MFLVAEQEGAVVGCAMFGFDGHRGWVNYLAVSPAHQRRGYASALMRALERKFLEMGCPKINLLIRSGNLAVKDFYASLGFQQDEVISLGGHKVIIKQIEADDVSQLREVGDRLKERLGSGVVF